MRHIRHATPRPGMPGDEDIPCDCEGRGWLRMTAGDAIVPAGHTAIQRCDECRILPDDEEAARAAARTGGGTVHVPGDGTLPADAGCVTVGPIAAYRIRPGDRVAGTWYGAEYSGRVTRARVHTIRHDVILLTVSFDAPVLFRHGGPDDWRTEAIVAVDGRGCGAQGFAPPTICVTFHDPVR